MRSIALLSVLLLLIAGSARADLRPPDEPADVKPKPKPAAPEHVTAKADLLAHIGGNVARVDIPKKVLAQLTSLDATPAKKGSGLAPFKTIFAGLALTFAFGFGGLYCVRRKSRFGQPLLVLCGVAALGLSLSAASRADVPPLNQATDPYHDAKLGTVTVEVVDEGDDVTVVLKPDDFYAMVKAAKGGDK